MSNRALIWLGSLSLIVLLGVWTAGYGQAATNSPPAAATQPQTRPGTATTAPDPSKMTMANYDMVKTGMKTDEVKAILGEPTAQESSGGKFLWFGGDKIHMTWTFGNKTITVIFLNDRVVRKSMSGL